MRATAFAALTDAKVSAAQHDSELELTNVPLAKAKHAAQPLRVTIRARRDTRYEGFGEEIAVHAAIVQAAGQLLAQLSRVVAEVSHADTELRQIGRDE